MRQIAVLLLLLGSVLAISWSNAAELLPVPPLKARVNDLTATLSPVQAAQLESQLAAFEARKGSQIVVLMVPTTAPEAIEQFSIRVAEAWKAGRRGVDDGIIVLIARDDRQLRIEVGYGLEGAVNDATARRIISEIMVPRLRNDDYFGALQAGLAQLMRVIDGEPLPAPRGEAQGGMSADEFQNFMPLVLGAIFVGMFLRSLIGRLAAGLLSGGVAGGAAWLFMQSAGAGLLLGFIVLVGVTLGSAGGRGSGWRGGSSGGYSGGGGGFGGGGASGRW